MYQKLKGKGIKLILSILVIMTLLNSIAPVCSRAENGIIENAFYGLLVEPVTDLVCSIGDTLINVMQDMLMPGAPVAVTVRNQSEREERLLKMYQEVYSKSYDELMEEYGSDLENAPEPMICYSPAAIFTNRVPALNINFINPLSNFDKQYGSIINNSKEIAGKQLDDAYYQEAKDKYGWSKEQASKAWALSKALESANSTEEKERYLGSVLINQDGEEISNPLANSAVIIGPTISKWYTALRNVAITGLLIILVYVGIRILLTSISDEKAKYKMMLKNWAVSIVLVFLLHYMMLGMITVTELIVDALDGGVYQKDQNGYVDMQDSLFNKVRLQETIERNNETSNTRWLDTFGYALLYTILVIYTLIFTWKYLKRLVYMVFLTIVAPMVAITYPIDKIGDKKAQAFNMWFKEYLFNLLLQPVHLLIYTVLVASALEFAKTNILYAIVALGFILEAEQFVKKMFGMQAKGGGFADFAAGALFSQGLTLIERTAGAASKAIAPKGGNSGGGSEGSDNRVRQQSMKDPQAELGLNAAFGNNDEHRPQTQTGAPIIIATRASSGSAGTEEETRTEGKIPQSESTVGPTPTPITEGITSPETKPLSIGKTNKKKKITGPAAGLKNVFGSATKKVWNIDTGKKAAKISAGIALGAIAGGTLATIGTAGGIALRNGTGKGAAAGLAAGVAVSAAGMELGSRAIKGIKDTATTVKENYDIGAKTLDERKAEANRKWRSEYLRRPEVQQKFLKDYGENAEIMMKNWDEAARYGTPDEAAMKMMENGYTPQEAMTTSDLIKKGIVTRKDFLNPESKEFHAFENYVDQIAKGDEKKTKYIYNAFDIGLGLKPKEMDSLRTSAKEENLKQAQKKEQQRQQHREEKRKKQEKAEERIRNDEKEKAKQKERKKRSGVEESPLEKTREEREEKRQEQEETKVRFHEPNEKQETPPSYTEDPNNESK